MDRYEAAAIFALLGDADRLKITKISYNHGENGIAFLAERMGMSVEEIKEKAKPLIEAGLLIDGGDHFTANKGALDEAMAFLTTRCGHCAH